MTDRINGPFHPALIADTVAALRQERKPAVSPMTVTHTVDHIAAEGRRLDPLADPNRDGAPSAEIEPDACWERLPGLHQMMPGTWAGMGAETAANPEGRTVSTSDRPSPLDREVARTYGTRRGSELTPAQFLLSNGVYEKARAIRRWVLERRLEAYTVKMIDPKGDGTGSNE